MACQAIYVLVKGKGSHEDACRRRLFASGALEAVSKVLARYSSSASEAATAAKAVVALAEGGDSAACAKFGNLGVCSTVVELLHSQGPASLSVARWCLRAVAVLAVGYQPNIAMLVAAGACEVIPLVVQRHLHSSAVAGAGTCVSYYASLQFAILFSFLHSTPLPLHL